MPDLRQELTELLDEATWEWLSPHAERDAIILVDGSLDLVEVGLAIAQIRRNRLAIGLPNSFYSNLRLNKRLFGIRIIKNALRL